MFLLFILLYLGLSLLLVAFFGWLLILAYVRELKSSFTVEKPYFHRAQ